MSSVEKILGGAPEKPGVYLMKDHRGGVFYIGKAKNLHKRMLQYINPHSDDRFFVQILHRILVGVEYIVTSTEKEALILESNLIKSRQPRFNIRIKDDSSFPSLRLDLQKDFPRLEFVRNRKNDGALYFEPYHSAAKARTVLDLINRYFSLRNCSDMMFRNAKRPCIRHQMGHCLAPCSLPVSREDYLAEVRKVRLFLEGKKELLLTELTPLMKAAAAALDFERAAVLRDQIKAVEDTLEKQVMEISESVEWDAVGFHREGELAEFALLQIRGGRVMGRQTFGARGYAVDDATLLEDFISQHYRKVNPLPHEILLPLELEDAASLSEFISEGKEGRVELVFPQRGKKKQLVEIAGENAVNAYSERQSAGRDTRLMLERLNKKLNLSHLPQRMECCDISTFQARESVGSVVCFVDGVAEKSEYRHYKIKSPEAVDDFAMMFEVLTRHFKHAIERGVLPDLLIVDGGKGQLNVAAAVMKDLGIECVDMVGLAKSRWKDEIGPDQIATKIEGRWQTPERVFLHNVKNPVVLNPGTSELLLLQRIRDEAHRFAIEYHRKVRRQKTLRSGLLDIPGVGSKRMKLLLTHFGSLKKMREATLEQIAALPEIPESVAREIFEFLKND